MLHVRLNPGLPGGKWARLPPLCGHDEAAVNGAGAVEVVAFLDRLLSDAPGTTVGPGKGAGLAVCDCDRLCAAIYVQYFGERVVGTAACRDCREPFEMTFSLSDLLEPVATRRPSTVSGPDDQGVFTLADGRRFRLPTIGQQCQVIGLEPGDAVAALLKACVVEGDPMHDPQALEAAMEEVGGLLDPDLDAACPQCGARQAVRFDIQSYLLRTLGHERQFLNSEVHCIATAYGWSAGEILGLTREDRRDFVRLIQADRSARRRAAQ
jgi:hypothetical protein